MTVHLVGGFLGSGKTTAIIAACKALSARGERVGVITNDQGKYLVDTAFFRAASLPAVEVSGGCFCCNYGDYKQMVRQIEETIHPTVVFAESVGSCSDIVATVIRPQELEGTATVGSFSVFVDIRLLRLWLAGAELPFTDDIVYLFSKQLEEAGLIVINKSDLLSRDDAEFVLQAAEERFPGKELRLQSSLSSEDIEDWVATITSGRRGANEEDSGSERVPAGAQAQERGPDARWRNTRLDLDYRRYGAAEASLAWYDANVAILAEPDGNSGRTAQVVREFLDRLRHSIVSNGFVVGHVKALVSYDGGWTKVSMTSGSQEIEGTLPEMGSGSVELVVNARVECAPDELKSVVRASLDEACHSSGREYSVTREASFRPPYPQPTHHLE